MANLETLELTISANSKSASDGIGSLITSLGNLSNAITEPCKKLTALNTQLKELILNCRSKQIKLPNLSQKTGASSVVSGAKKSSVTDGGRLATPEEIKKYGLPTDVPNTKRNVAYSKEEALALKEEADKTESSLVKLKKGFDEAFKGASNFFSKIKRIATTMLIRSAIRGLIKSIREGISNLYEWSKLNNGEFAKSLDTLKSKTQQLKNSIGASIAPVIQAIIPVLTNLANAAIEAFNWINQLISLLSGKTSWTRAKQGADDFTDSAKKASGAAKEWIASFDELNVMSKDSGGGSTATTETDYSDMFEQVYVFDETVRKIVGFIKENFESIKRIALEIGGVIALWKIGTALADALPLLSQIMGYVATAGVIAIVMELSWMFSKKYMQTGESGWLWADLLTTALGSTAAWAIAKNLIGAKAAVWAVSITLVASAVMGIIANISETDVGALNAKSIKKNIVDALKIGAAAGIVAKTMLGATLLTAAGVAGLGAIVTFLAVLGIKALTSKDNVTVDPTLVTLTEEQCKAFVKGKMFTVDPDITVSVIKDNITVAEGAETALREAITGTIGTLNVINLGLQNDNDYANIKEQILGENGLIAKVNEWINSAEATSKLVLKFTPQIVGNSTEDQNAWYVSNIAGWEEVRKFVKGLGAQLADEMIIGENDELIIKRPERVQALLNEITRITEIIAGSDAATEAQIDFGLKMKDLAPDSFDDAIKYFKEYKTKIAEAAEEMQKTAYTNQARLVNALKTMIEIDPDNDELKQQLVEAEATLAYIKENWNTAVEDAVNGMASPGIEMMKEKIYGIAEKGSLGWNKDDSLLKAFIDADGLQEAIYEILYENGFREAEIQAMQLVNISGWEFLKDDLKKKLINCLEFNADTIAELKAIGVPADELVNITGWEQITKMGSNNFVKAILDAYGTNGISAIKSKFPQIEAMDILKLVNWKDFTLKEQLNFLTAIKDAFGSDEAKRMAKEAGIDIGNMVEEGMNSQDADIRKQAEEWSQIINDGVEKEQPVVKPELDKYTVTNISSALKSGIERNTNPDVKVTATPKSNAIKNLEAIVENSAKPVITARAAVARNTLLDVYHQIADMTPDITVGIQKTSNFNAVLSEISNGVLSAFEQVFKATVNGSLVGTLSILPALATGGLVTSGDVFVANENGNSELIGRFGNQTGVANQMEIISGIEKGVADANREQNELLRAQNNLLRGILEKDNTVRIGASAALGRVTRQSLDMYSAVMG